MNKRNLIIASVTFILALGVSGFYLWSQKKADLTQTNTEKQEEQAVKQGEDQEQEEESNKQKILNLDNILTCDLKYNTNIDMSSWDIFKDPRGFSVKYPSKLFTAYSIPKSPAHYSPIYISPLLRFNNRDKNSTWPVYFDFNIYDNSVDVDFNDIELTIDKLYNSTLETSLFIKTKFIKTKEDAYTNKKKYCMITANESYLDITYIVQRQNKIINASFRLRSGINDKNTLERYKYNIKFLSIFKAMVVSIK